MREIIYLWAKCNAMAAISNTGQGSDKVNESEDIRAKCGGDWVDLLEHPDSKVIERIDGHEIILLPDGRMMGVITDLQKSIEGFKKTSDYKLFMEANGLEY